MAEEKITFERALEELEKIVSQIEEGEVSLEESIQKYEAGRRLIRQCRVILDAAERKIQLLAKGEDGSAEVTGELQEPAE